MCRYLRLVARRREISVLKIYRQKCMNQDRLFDTTTNEFSEHSHNYVTGLCNFVKRGMKRVSIRRLLRLKESKQERFSVISKTLYSTMSVNPLDFWVTAPSKTVVPVEPDVVYGRSENIRVKQNIGYIVCGVILRGSKDDAEVLLIQEVQNDWYLPAGRLEAGETIEDGMKREVKEEAGVECESMGLISVETGRPAWYRFTYLARHSGGDLKTPAQRDQESIQASWFRVSQLLNGSLPPEMRLRSRDIIHLVRLAFMRRFEEGADEHRPCHAETIERPLVGLFARFILLSKNKVLLRAGHFPLVEYSLIHNLSAVVAKFLETVTDASYKSDDFKVASIEALPIPAYKHDGSCITIVIDVSSPTVRSQAHQEGFQWIDLASDKALADAIGLWRSNYAVLHL